MSSIPEHGEDALQEAEGAEVIEVALDAGHPLGRGCDVRLAGCPRQQSVGRAAIPRHACLPIPADGSGEEGRLIAHCGKPGFEQGIRASNERLLVDISTLCQHIFFEDVEPAVHDVAQRTLGRVRRCEPLHEPPVHGFELVEGRLGLRNLHLARDETLPAGPIGQPAGEERLSAAVITSHGLEDAPSGRHGFEVGIDGRLESFKANAERIEARAGDCAPPQGVDDLAGPCAADRHGWSLPVSEIPNCTRSVRLSNDTVSLSISTVITG